MKKVSKQPYRLWFQYLQTCLNHKELSKKVDREFYKDWHLKKVKTERFDTWFKSHFKLFQEYDSKIKLYNSKDGRTQDTTLVEIPKNYNVRKIQNEIGSVLKGQLNQSNAIYSITSNRPLMIDKFDYFLWCWKLKQKEKYQGSSGLEKIWIALDNKVKGRQSRQQSRVDKGTIRKRLVTRGDEKYIRAIYISRNIKKAKKILSNVCKGQFPGLDYSDN